MPRRGCGPRGSAVPRWARAVLIYTEIVKHARNVAILMLIALAVVALPGGGDTAGAGRRDLLAADRRAARLLRRRASTATTRSTSTGCGDVDRAILYVALGAIVVIVLAASGRLSVSTARHADRNRAARAVRRRADPRLPQLAAVLSPRAELRPDLATQRRTLPDQPGVYLFRDRAGRVIYVGKAISMRKRVASHFGSRRQRGDDRRGRLDRERRRRQRGRGAAGRAGASSSSTGRASTSACATTSPTRSSAISLDEDFPRVYFTRERHRRDRAYFGPYSNAKRVRETLDLLGPDLPDPLVHRGRAGAAIGLAVPRLPHQPLRGAVRRLRLARGVPARDRPRRSTSSAAATARSSASSSSG